MFEDSLVESGGRIKTKRGATTALSFILEILVARRFGIVAVDFH